MDFWDDPLDRDINETTLIFPRMFSFSQVDVDQNSDIFMRLRFSKRPTNGTLLNVGQEIELGWEHEG